MSYSHTLCASRNLTPKACYWVKQAARPSTPQADGALAGSYRGVFLDRVRPTGRTFYMTPFTPAGYAAGVNGVRQ